MLCQKFGLDAQERERRLSLNRIGEADRAALVEIGKVVTPHMDRIVDAFYGHVGRFPEALAIVSSAGKTIDDLKKTNPQYFEEMFRGEFDEQYFESRLRIGAIHAKIGLDASLYYGAMSTYLDTVLPIVVAKWKLQPKKLSAALVALTKAINLDQALTIEAYVEFGFVGELSDIVTDASGAAEALGQESQAMGRASEESGHASEELAKISESLAIRATESAEVAVRAESELTSLRGAIESLLQGVEMNRSSSERADQALLQVSSALEAIADNARQWEELRERVSALTRVRESVQATAESVHDTQTRASEIERIVQTIEEIAERTNLLALNAAIEAARAGEHGRGFAVVAEEVRSLAENSSVAAREITELVRRVQEASADATRLTDATSADMEDAAAATSEATACLERIATHSAEASQLNQGLRVAMSELQEVAEQNLESTGSIESSLAQVSESVDGSRSASEDNAAAAEELNATAEELGAQVQELSATVLHVDAQLQDLRGAIAKASAAADKAKSRKAA